MFCDICIGYSAYVGFILLEHQHSNPVLQCFVRLLLEMQSKNVLHGIQSPEKSGKFAAMYLVKEFYFPLYAVQLFGRLFGSCYAAISIQVHCFGTQTAVTGS